LISIIIPTYNRSEFLLNSINSILSQSIKDFEILVVDDGSTDNTKEVVTNLSDKRILYFNYGKIGNISKLRNIGIKKSNYDIIGFCDDDDLWSDPDKLKKQLKHLKNYNLVCSNALVIDSEGNTIKEKYYHEFDKDFIVDKSHLLSRGNSVLTPGILLNKNLLIKHNLFFDETEFSIYCEDYEFLIRLSSYTEMYFVAQTLISVRIHDSVSGGFDNKMKMLNSSIKILKNHSALTKYNVDKVNVKKGIIGFHICIIKLSYVYNNYICFKEVLRFLIFLGNPKNIMIFFNLKIIPFFKNILSSKSIAKN